MKLIAPLAAWIIILPAAPIHAALHVPKVFSDHMVLQRDKPLPVWGTASPGATVTVALNSAVQTSKAAEDGRWQVKLPPQKASSTPVTLTVKSEGETSTFSDVLVGDVWLCSGQSNMDFGLGGADGGHEAATDADKLDTIRLLHITAPASSMPLADIPNTWSVCGQRTAASFSAVGFFFGRAVREKIGVPIGLIQASWPGTPIQAWTPKSGYELDEKLRPVIQQIDEADKTFRAAVAADLPAINAWAAQAGEALKTGAELPPAPPWPVHPLVPDANPRKDTVIFNSRVHPLIPCAIRGVIWYQGETNREDGLFYANRMRALIRSWRELWGEGDFPFYYVQLAPLAAVYGKDQLVKLWQAQTSCLDLPNTGMAVTNDIGSLTTIHPTDKKDVGERLALIAFAHEYGLPGIVDSGPVYRAMKIVGQSIGLEFDHAEEGLISRDGKPLNWFEIAGQDNVFHPATATIRGSEIVVSSPQVPQPKAVRFAWANDAVPNLTNHAGLPARAFNTNE